MGLGLLEPSFRIRAPPQVARFVRYCWTFLKLNNVDSRYWMSLSFWLKWVLRLWKQQWLIFSWRRRLFLLQQLARFDLQVFSGGRLVDRCQGVLEVYGCFIGNCWGHVVGSLVELSWVLAFVLGCKLFVLVSKSIDCMSSTEWSLWHLSSSVSRLD